MKSDLKTFILDILRPTSKQSPAERLNYELYTIRQLFTETRPKRAELKNAISKLAFIAISGRQINFGLPQIMTFLCSNIYSEVQIGWLTLIAINPTDPNVLNQIIPELLRQLHQTNDEAIQCAAISVVSQLQCAEISEVVGPEIAKIAIHPITGENARKKALLTVARIYQTTRLPDLVELLAPALPIFIQSTSMSIQLATATLTLIFMTCQPGAFIEVFPYVLKQLSLLFVVGINQSAVMYYGTPSPWYSMQLIRILRFKTHWDLPDKSLLEQVALALFSRAGEKLPVRAAFSYLIVFSELTSLLSTRPLSSTTMEKCAHTLTRYLSLTSINVIYFALDSLNRVLKTNPNLAHCVQPAMPILYQHLRNPDPGISGLSASLLFQIGNPENSLEIINELLDFLPFSHLILRASICSQVAMLAQANSNQAFYISSVTRLLFQHGEYCEEFIWQAAARVIVNDETISLKQSAYYSMLRLLPKIPPTAQMLMKLAVYVIGECAGLNFCERFRRRDASMPKGKPESVEKIRKMELARAEKTSTLARDQANQVIDSLMALFGSQNGEIQYLMVTSIVRICLRVRVGFELILPKIQEFLLSSWRSTTFEVAQRAREYCTLIMAISHPDMLMDIIAHLPPDFDENELEARCEAFYNRGASFFDPDREDMIEPISLETMISSFRDKNSGTFFLDFFLGISVSFCIHTNLFISNFEFENRQDVKIEQFAVSFISPNHVDPKGDEIDDIDIQIKSPLSHNEIPGKDKVQLTVDFGYLFMTAEMPKLRVSFTCGGNPHVCEAIIPIHYCLLIQVAPLSTVTFGQSWESCKKRTNMVAMWSIDVPSPEVSDHLIQGIGEFLQYCFNLTPLQIDKLPNYPAPPDTTAIYAAGIFHCKQNQVEFLLVIIIGEDSVTVEVGATPPHALNVISEDLKEKLMARLNAIETSLIQIAQSGLIC